MRRNRPRLFLAAATAAVLASVALADQVGRAADPGAPAETRQAANDSRAGVQIGGRLDPARLHPVTRPGLYGMSQPPSGSRYGIVEGRLIRYDPDNAQVLSVIREVEQILD